LVSTSTAKPSTPAPGETSAGKCNASQECLPRENADESRSRRLGSNCRFGKDQIRRLRAWPISKLSSVRSLLNDGERRVMAEVKGGISVKASWWMVGSYFLTPIRSATQLLQSAIASTSVRGGSDCRVR